MSQYHAIVFATKSICRATYDDCRATESLYSATKNFSHMIKQLLHQYHKILALSNIKGELASSFSSNIARSQYFVVLMQSLINILSDNLDLILIKITQVNSQPLLLLKEDELSPPKSDDADYAASK